MRRSTLWLVGMMGSGKTAVGRMVAERTGSPFFDTDREVTARAGCSIGELWGLHGEGAFRDLEQEAVSRLAGEPAVVATGGGVVLRAANVERMRSSGAVVWLDATPSELARRVGDGRGRPLLSGDEPAESKLEGLLGERAGLYASASHHHVRTDGLGLDEVAAEVETLWTAF